jgi:hypothetical protein
MRPAPDNDFANGVVESPYDPSEDSAGKPLKTPGEIRKTLKNIHNAQAEGHDAPGPWPRGLGPDDWCTVLSRWQSLDLSLCAALLDEREIEWRFLGEGRKRVLQVRNADRERVNEWFREESYRLRPFKKQPLKKSSIAPRVLVTIAILIGALPVCTAVAELLSREPGRVPWDCLVASGMITVTLLIVAGVACSRPWRRGRV